MSARVVSAPGFSSSVASRSPTGADARAAAIDPPRAAAIDSPRLVRSKPAAVPAETYCLIAPYVRLGHYQLGTLDRVLPAEDDKLFDEIVDVELTRFDAN